MVADKTGVSRQKAVEPTQTSRSEGKLDVLTEVGGGAGGGGDGGVAGEGKGGEEKRERPPREGMLLRVMCVCV